MFVFVYPFFQNPSSKFFNAKDELVGEHMETRVYPDPIS